MLFLQVDEDKLSSNLFPGLRAWINELNSYRAEPVKVVMAVEDDRTLGAVVFEEGNIIAINVEPTVRRGGVGRKLVDYVREASKGQHLICRIPPNAPDLICFFSACGFLIESWYIGADGARYIRMTDKPLWGDNVVPGWKSLGEFVTNVPVFMSVGNKVY